MCPMTLREKCILHEQHSWRETGLNVQEHEAGVPAVELLGREAEAVPKLVSTFRIKCKSTPSSEAFPQQ